MAYGLTSMATLGLWDTGPASASTGVSPTTSTTTWAAVRQQMVDTIKALTPSSLSDEKYTVTDTEQPDFAAYAEAEDSTVLREYEIEMISDELDGVSNHQLELRIVEADLSMAYPHHWGTYQTKDAQGQHNERALRALANEDRNIIDRAIGIRGGSNYVTAQRSCNVGPIEFDELDGVTIMSIPLTVQFYQDAS